MPRSCGMGCDADAEHGGFYCHGCLARWAREEELERRKKVEASVEDTLESLRAEVAELRRLLDEKSKVT